MAKTEDKKSFPRIPTSQWWKLREKFKQSIPPTVTPSYISTALNGMNVDSAKKNIIPPLKTLGIINEENKPTDKAKLWRDDEAYSKLCQEIREEVYPEDLLHAQPPPSPDKDAVKRWFANATSSGDGAATQMAATYLLLCEAKPIDKENLKAIKGSSERTKNGGQKRPDKTAQIKNATNEVADNMTVSAKQHSNSKLIPSVHIDVQIHISPESSAEQIDQIFESMAKHLGNMSNGKD